MIVWFQWSFYDSLVKIHEEIMLKVQPQPHLSCPEMPLSLMFLVAGNLMPNWEMFVSLWDLFWALMRWVTVSDSPHSVLLIGCWSKVSPGVEFYFTLLHKECTFWMFIKCLIMKLCLLWIHRTYSKLQSMIRSPGTEDTRTSLQLLRFFFFFFFKGPSTNGRM